VKPAAPDRPARFRFEKLQVWHDARYLGRDIYRLTQSFPSAELYGLTSQMRRAVVSVAANIAEGSGRNSDRDFAHFLEQSYGSAMELASHLYLASDLGFLGKESLEALLACVESAAKRIAALNRSLNINESKVRVGPPSTLDSRLSTQL
jgi:four helix bundle protein